MLMEIKENMITLEGYQAVKKELLKLYKEKRPQIIEDLKVIVILVIYEKILNLML